MIKSAMASIYTVPLLATILMLLAVSCQAQASTNKTEWMLQYMQNLYDAQKRKTAGPSEIIHQLTKTLEFDWPCDYVKEFYQDRGLFDPTANILSGVDVFNNVLYATVFRTSKKVPSGLNRVLIKEGKSLLQPYPSLKMNELGNCSCLQNPAATTIDPNTGYMYVIDTGSLSVLPIPPEEISSSSESSSNSTPTNETCPPKLVVLDINKNGSLVRSHDLSSTVSSGSNYIKDIVLDYGNPRANQVQHAFIADSNNAAIIVFSFSTNTSWFFQHDSMINNVNTQMNLNGINYNIDYNIGSIAIDKGAEYVYFSTLGSVQLSQIPASILRDPMSNFSEGHRYVGNMVSPSPAIVFGKRNLYFSAANLSAVYRWNYNQDIQNQNVSKENLIMQSQVQIMNDVSRDYWIDRLRIDVNGYLWSIVRALTSDPSGNKGSHYKIYKIFINDNSSIFLEN